MDDADERSADDDERRTERGPGFTATDGGRPVEFLDCETVRVTESTDEVFLWLFWWDEQGLVGTLTEPVGSVDCERTISATDEFGAFAYGPVVTEVELFDAGTPTVPGRGDLVVSNPNAASCARAIREDADSPDDLEPVAVENRRSEANRLE